MKNQNLKKNVRKVIVARNTLKNMANGVGYKNEIGQKYLAKIAIDVMGFAKRVHPLMPYYLATKKV